jgi:hypothetical protein
MHILNTHSDLQPESLLAELYASGATPSAAPPPGNTRLELKPDATRRVN